MMFGVARFASALLVAVALLASGVATFAQTRNPIKLKPHPLPIPPIAVPQGYGHYCSITYNNGGWMFGALPSADSDPCDDMLKQNPGGTIQRAGLWNTQGENNVLVRCGGDLRIYRAHGSQPTDLAFNQSQGKANCIFTVAPTRLPIFGHPWGTSKGKSGPDDDVDKVNETGFNYDILGQPGDVSEFGQPQDPQKPATQVDRYGRNSLTQARRWSALCAASLRAATLATPSKALMTGACRWANR